MSPELLEQYLKVMRNAGVQSAKLTLGIGEELAVVLGPAFDSLENHSASPIPGGWKGTHGLDEPSETESEP